MEKQEKTVALVASRAKVQRKTEHGKGQCGGKDHQSKKSAESTIGKGKSISAQ